METTLFRFNGTESFPLFSADTTARAPVTIRTDNQGVEPFLRIAAERHSDDPPQVAIVIALPLIAIVGSPEQLLLKVLGDASGCDIRLEAGDARGWGFSYSFGPVNFAGWRSCVADTQQPGEFWGVRRQENEIRIIPPVQPFRLTVLLNAQCQGVDIGLHDLRVTGEVRLAPPGIASLDTPGV